ncbi:MAG: hypothetical protein ABMA25_22755 [Ilumatobacteraceae bacterium]
MTFQPPRGPSRAHEMEAHLRGQQAAAQRTPQLARRLPTSRLGDWLDGHRGTTMLIVVGALLVLLFVVA